MFVCMTNYCCLQRNDLSLKLAKQDTAYLNARAALRHDDDFGPMDPELSTQIFQYTFLLS